MELWSKIKCRNCGTKYFFGDGPACGCRDEKDLWKEEYNIGFRDTLWGDHGY